MSYFLSICIPTYNGGENLKYNVNKLIKMQPEYGFEICVSDNASDDGTQEFMTIAANEYEFIKYHRNKENMGIAYNFDYVLNMASGEYRWLLGDDDEIVEENLGKVKQSLKEKKPDICVINGGPLENLMNNRCNHDRFFDDKNEILSKFGVHMTWMSSLIFSSEMLKNLKIKECTFNAFPHAVEVFKFLDKKCNLFWISKCCVTVQHNYQNRYTKHYLEYFIRDWIGITQLIGNYSETAKNEFCKNSETRLFSLKAILSLKARNLINQEIISRSITEDTYKYFSKKTILYIRIINLMPNCILKIFYKIYKHYVKKLLS